ETPLLQANQVLARARSQLRSIDATWLVSPLADKLKELDDRVARAAHDAHTGVMAVRVVPALLGGDGERKYFVAFETPSESRASGGIIGSFAELSFSGG